MQIRKDGESYWIVLSKGEDVLPCLSKFAQSRNLNGAAIWGIGAVSEVELGAFDTKSGQYSRRKFEGIFELASFMGNINVDGIHAHATISGADFKPYSGHFFGGKIAVAGEFFALPSAQLSKVPLEGTSFRRIDLEL